MSGTEGTGGDDLSGYDAVIAACRPVEWTEEFQIPDLEPTPIYPGSIVVECQGCSRAIYVGPRAQALEIPHYLVCFLCAAVASQRDEVDSNIRNLGNPYLPR